FFFFFFFFGASLVSFFVFKFFFKKKRHLFPETLYKLFIVNASWTFRAIWKIVSNFVDPITYQKVLCFFHLFLTSFFFFFLKKKCSNVNVLGGSYLDEMSKIIDKNEIPPKYGGTASRLIAYGMDSEDAEAARQQEAKEPTEEKEKEKGNESENKS
ncbi:SEC14 cytosolic factor, partial [Reticulomyxa filosa]